MVLVLLTLRINPIHNTFINTIINSMIVNVVVRYSTDANPTRNERYYSFNDLKTRRAYAVYLFPTTESDMNARTATELVSKADDDSIFGDMR
jgi:flagellar motor protein MotB